MNTIQYLDTLAQINREHHAEMRREARVAHLLQRQNPAQSQTRWLKPVLLAAVCVALALAAACTGRADTPAFAGPAPATAAPGACALLTPADAEAFLGASVGQPETPLDGAAAFVVTSCKYQAADNRLTLIVVQAAKGGAQATRSAFEMGRQNAPEVDVPGLGEAAFWVSGDHGSDLHVLKGSVRFSLNTGGAPSAAPPPALQALAAKISGQLP